VGLAAANALLALALAGVDGTAVDLQASGRAETSALGFATPVGGMSGLAALDVLPKIALRLDQRTLRLAIAYEPQLRASESLSYPAGDVTLVQGGSALAEWDLHPLLKATGAARSVDRILDFLTVGAGDLARLVDLRGAPPVFRFREDAASVGLEGRPTQLLTTTATASGSSSRGLGASGAAAVPGMREGRVAVAAARAQSPSDVLRLELAGAGAAFDAGGSASLATASAGWMRQATRTLRFRVLGSVSGVRDRTTAGDLVPGGEAGLDATPMFLGRPLTVSAAVRAGPAFDRFVARVQERLGATATATWALTPRLGLGAAGAFARVREPQGYAAGRGDLRAEWKATRRLTLYADVWNEQHRDPVAAGTASYLGTSVGVLLAPVPP
jgi:hypothetical protein